ncbi:MAG: hypothetical protein ACRBN8_30555 [Nannocystales bacterium]
MSREAAPRPSVWLPVLLTSLAVGAVVAGDWSVHENVSIASVFTAHHSDGVRYAIHLGTLVVLGLWVAAKPKRVVPVWVTGLILIVVNTLATARIVMTMSEDPHTAVAGVELEHVALRKNTGKYYAHRVCFDRFSRSERSVEIDGHTLAPPFLPLPIEWRDVEHLIPELTCVGGT